MCTPFAGALAGRRLAVAGALAGRLAGALAGRRPADTTVILRPLNNGSKAAQALVDT